MKNKLTILSITLLLFSLTSCNQGIVHPVSDYENNLEFKDDFKILQLSDIHLSAMSNDKEEMAFLSKIVNKAQPDLICITGDSFLHGTKENVDDLYSTMDSYNIPWTIIWGNHDAQGTYPANYILDRLESCKNLIFSNPKDDDVYGDSNYFINLKKGDELKFQLYMMDSNSYAPGSMISLDYDYFHQDQIDWYERMMEVSNPSRVPSFMYFHIPLCETIDVWQALPVEEQKGTSSVNGEQVLFNNKSSHLLLGERNEMVACSSTNTHMYDKIKELGSTKGLFFGHDHENNFSVEYEGITFNYCQKTGRGCYHQEEDSTNTYPFYGGKLTTIHADLSYDIELVVEEY